MEYGEDVQKVRAVLQRIIDADPRILTTPAPMIVLKTLNASSVDIMVRAWTKTENYWQVRWDVLEGIKEAFDANGIEIPFNQMDINIRHTS